MLLQQFCQQLFIVQTFGERRDIRILLLHITFMWNIFFMYAELNEEGSARKIIPDLTSLNTFLSVLLYVYLQ
jgi:hypothetical protein